MLLEQQDAPEYDEAYTAHYASMEKGSTALLNALMGNQPQPGKRPDTIRRVLAEQTPRRRTLWPRWYHPPGVTAMLGDELLADIANDFGITIGELIGDSRRELFVDARAVVVRILCDRGWSYPRIARRIGRNDHSTVINLRNNFAIYANRNARVGWSFERQRVRHGRAA